MACRLHERHVILLKLYIFHTHFRQIQIIRTKRQTSNKRNVTLSRSDPLNELLFCIHVGAGRATPHERRVISLVEILEGHWAKPKPLIQGLYWDHEILVFDLATELATNSRTRDLPSLKPLLNDYGLTFGKRVLISMRSDSLMSLADIDRYSHLQKMVWVLNRTLLVGEDRCGEDTAWLYHVVPLYLQSFRCHWPIDLIPHGAHVLHWSLHTSQDSCRLQRVKLSEAKVHWERQVDPRHLGKRKEVGEAAVMYFCRDIVQTALRSQVLIFFTYWWSYIYHMRLILVLKGGADTFDKLSTCIVRL